MQLPINTGDILRHIYHGIYVNQQGLSTAGYSLAELNPSNSWIAWSTVQYNYPVITLLFFSCIVKISPTLFFTKLVLTLIEAINSWLIYRLTRQHILALIYWMSPISIWWASHEGQFEPLQNFFVICALLLLSRKKYGAFFLLALGIQVKVTAILLLPFFIVSCQYCQIKNWARAAVFFTLGFFPSFFAMYYYQAIQQVFPKTWILAYNPYYWNIFNPSIFRWNRRWLVICNQVASYGMLLLLSVLIIRWKKIKYLLAPALFIILCKLSTVAQFWYFMVFMPFLLPVRNKRVRIWLFALTPLLDVSSLVQILSGPIGHTVGNYYQGIDCFTPLIIGKPGF